MFRMYSKKLDAAEIETICRIKDWAFRWIGEKVGI